MTILELKRYCYFYLNSTFDVGELQCVVARLMLDVYGVSKNDVILCGDKQIDIDVEILDKILSRISDGEPIQYVVAQESFGDLNLYVDNGVLIPRPETEELVNIIIDENRAGVKLSILDIGTGSGAIGLSLARAFGDASVRGLDISDSALTVARKNRSLHNVKNIEFEKCDILSIDALDATFDIIVSNPPYVTNSERGEMCSNVLDYEPHSALFVEDDNPLLFYKKIADLASKSLNKGGKLYFEINERFSSEVQKLLEECGFSSVVGVDDFRDKPRFVKGVIL
ncbi:MAG: peptide chain release factor N(5)-glutamine methyltransferase [Rikenellaceae bacterium]